MSAYHTPVLLEESVDALAIRPDGVYVDATYGGGGHSRAILERLSEKGRLIAFDRDSDAIGNAPKDGRLIPVHNNFRFIHHFVRYYGYTEVDGILADLGVSSHQFDTSYRGFSFRFSAPLDMRMNNMGGRRAADILNSSTEEELESIFRLYGELDNSRKVAGLITRAREQAAIETTDDLGRAIEEVLPKVAPHKYLAKLYQALRIEVNGEMSALEGFLEGSIKSLRQGGRISVITYHSLEDRMVKNFFKCGNRDGVAEKDLYGRTATALRQIGKKPAVPAEEEISGNTRARSAKLRVAEKI